MVICWTTLADDATVPTSVVVDINDALGAADAKAVLHDGVVSSEKGRIECAAKFVVDEVLPTDWKTEDVEAID